MTMDYSLQSRRSGCTLFAHFVYLKSVPSSTQQWTRCVKSRRSGCTPQNVHFFAHFVYPSSVHVIRKKLTKKKLHFPTTPLTALYLLYLCPLTDSRKMASTSRFCNQPIKSRPGQRCTNLAKHDVEGVKCCGKHIKFIVDKRSLPPPTFGPFDCSICMDQCGKVSDSCTTICNHRFHKACLSKWEESAMKGGKIFTCPLCRNKLPSKIEKSISASIANDEPLRFRLQLEQLIEMIMNRWWGISTSSKSREYQRNSGSSGLSNQPCWYRRGSSRGWWGNYEGE